MTNANSSMNFTPATSSTAEIANEWLLPDGVHDVLFADADKQEYLRHHLLNQLQSKGYELVTPPLIEFTESLLGNASEDLKRQTFKLIDQLTGRLMGLRADTTPQILRIDANYGGVGISRYCYAGHTIHTLPTGLFGLRTPLQLGAEIFGTDAIEADFELLDVMCGLFDNLPLTTQIHLDLGHVGIFARLTQLANLDEDSIEQITQLYDNKALPELNYLCQSLPMGEDFFTLAKYGHNLNLLQEKLSLTVIADSIIIKALNELQRLYDYLQQQNDSKSEHTGNYTGIDISIDVSDLSGYHYHSGMMFNLYLGGGSQPFVRGGRFDGSSQLNGSRPAIGFSMDVTRLLPHFEMQQASKVLVNFDDIDHADDSRMQAMNNKVAQLRAEGYRVIVPLSAEDKSTNIRHCLGYDQNNNEWQLIPKTA